ncbi:unnamed protein product [Macrosiphum euphorbiae]|uniref:Uncharacterized protein n=1 Tax=Macrosiphum euphorbiae TaxID=13131 RepID=A0AAV0X9K4_9HEMI|nr:unnamed protein product [Macrosiphum euphorbiae]
MYTPWFSGFRAELCDVSAGGDRVDQLKHPRTPTVLSSVADDARRWTIRRRWKRLRRTTRNNCQLSLCWMEARTACET